jgi:predicted amidohydrolase YtcJ
MRTILLAAILGVLALGAAPTAAPPASADLVFRHGPVYTVDGPRSWAEAVAVTNGRIVFVGTDAAAAAWIGPSTRVVDLSGKMLLPAFHDSHVHPRDGVELFECDLTGLPSAEAVLEAVRVYAQTHPDAPWILGSGWDLPIFPDGNPSKTLLDRVVLDRPALLYTSDGHSAWANSKALAIAGLTKATPDPPNGRIERDASGAPSGTLREDAKDLVRKNVPKRTPQEIEAGQRKGVEIANSFGLTSLQDANVSERNLEAYAALEASGALTARVSAAILVDADKGVADLPRLKELRARYRGKRFHADAVKIFADGVIETRTASLLEPYIGYGSDRGKTNLEPADFRALATALDREGFQIHVHAIGDRAVRDTLDALEAARNANGVRDARHHIAHLELIDPADIPRFRRVGVIANFQPFWANGDQYITRMTEPELGPARSRWIYPIASVEKAGAVTAFGSDWRVSSMNPLDGIEVAVTRRDPSTGPGPAWLPEERIDLPDAIAGYTIRGAYLDFTEKETGSIEVGKAADLIVLDRNLFEIPSSQIHEAKVLWTLLDGKEVYRAAGFAP